MQRSTAMPTHEAAATHPIRLVQRLRNKAIALQKLHDRERRRMREEIGRVPGLMALLMKSRNGNGWTADERAALRTQLGSMRRLGLYVATIMVPGTVLTLPLIAWWLDRRHTRRLAMLDVRGTDR